MDSQNWPIDVFTTQIGEIYQLLLQVVGNKGQNEQQENINEWVAEPGVRKGNNQRFAEDIKLEFEKFETLLVNPNHQNQNTFKVNILPFLGNMKIKDFLDWLLEVERFFEIMDASKDKMVMMVAFRLRCVATVWWNQLQNAHRRQKNGRIRTWIKMKHSMIDRFLPANYEQILCSMYLGCTQGNCTISNHTNEFMPLAERNNLLKSENQKIARYTSGLKVIIQDRIGLQNIWILQEIINMAMKAGMMKSDKREIWPHNIIPERELQESRTNSFTVTYDGFLIGEFPHHYQKFMFSLQNIH